MQMSTRFFADLSSNNAEFNAREYAKAGHLLVALKATEGVGFVDPAYKERRHQAHRANLSVVHYHFARPDNHPGPQGGEAEAHAFLAAVRGGFGKLDGIVVDVERGTPAQAGPGWLRGFETVCHRAMPHNPLILYRSRDNYTTLNTGRTWVAAYDGKIMPLLGGPPKDSWAHQFTDGRVGATPHVCAGIGHCDISRLNNRSYQRLRRARA